MPSLTILIAIVVAIVLLILIAYGLVIYGLRDVFYAGQDIGSRLATYVTLPEEAAQQQAGARRRTGLLHFRLRLNNLLSGVASEKLNLQLISANWPITETEYVLIRFWSVLLGFGLGYLITRRLESALGLAVIIFFIPDLILKRSISQRRVYFGKQLVEVLILMTGAVRAGY
ncbi:MAG: hypothetical protein ACM3H7_00470, partial [Acidobacteriaceae bacterium]